eukprot:TRINITY_DN27614_c0_g2_i1.p1 TRINITY_DN27614_c0_g2~~TRINITY_DN27614_c0_g2_i1.p1  ORF type:complete len:775 (+),score=104.22 TRINITY_DN27614_c0_g2_i1:101-2326(+)
MSATTQLRYRRRRRRGLRAGGVGVLAFLLPETPRGHVDTGMNDLLSRGKYACLDPGKRNWPQVHRSLLRFLDGQGSSDELRPALGQAFDIQPSLAETPQDDCVLGQVSLRFLLLVVSGETLAPEEAAHALSADWSVIRGVGLVPSIRSGWPLFRVLRSLHVRTVRFSSASPASPTLRQCDAESEPERKYVAILDQYVGHRRMPPSETLIAASMEYLATSTERCPLTVAAAFLAVAWCRFPLYDAETESLLRKAESYIHGSTLEALLGTEHPLLSVLDDVASTYQAFLIDSGSLYGDTSQSQGPGPAPPGPVDYTRHMMDDAAFAKATGGACVVPFARTPTGHCNFFAPITRSLSYWRNKGVQFEDTLMAFRQITDQKNILFRIIGEDLYIVIPQHSHFSADFGAQEPACLAHTLLTVLAKAELPDLDLVLNHGDLPLLRGMPDRPPFYGPQDRDPRIPAPLFSICASEDFWDIPFPNTCRPALVNISGLSSTSWPDKYPGVFWRGTDRGAVNWAIDPKDMWRGSPRKQFVERWGGGGVGGGRDIVGSMGDTSGGSFNLAFLEDDLLNASVVNTDGNFVPLDRWLDWKFVLDLPGNGYSGSLKQKLTGSSAVVLVTDIARPGATPVYEHYHAGLQDRTHVLAASMHDAESVVQWAVQHDNAAAQIVKQANEYMSHFDEYSQCYLWRLLTLYGELLRYKPKSDQLAAFGDTNVEILHIHRRPSPKEAVAFRQKCMRIIDEQSQ